MIELNLPNGVGLQWIALTIPVIFSYSESVIALPSGQSGLYIFKRMTLFKY
jgi:hypothetical protein